MIFFVISPLSMFDGKMMLRMWRHNFILPIAEPSDVQAKSHPQSNKATTQKKWVGRGGEVQWGYFENILHLIESLWCALQDEIYMVVCDVVQNGRHIVVYWKLEITKKRWKLEKFHAGHN